MRISHPKSMKRDRERVKAGSKKGSVSERVSELERAYTNHGYHIQRTILIIL